MMKKRLTSSLKIFLTFMEVLRDIQKCPLSEEEKLSDRKGLWQEKKNFSIITFTCLLSVTHRIFLFLFNCFSIGTNLINMRPAVFVFLVKQQYDIYRYPFLLFSRIIVQPIHCGNRIDRSADLSSVFRDRRFQTRPPCLQRPHPLTQGGGEILLPPLTLPDTQLRPLPGQGAVTFLRQPSPVEVTQATPSSLAPTNR